MTPLVNPYLTFFHALPASCRRDARRPIDCSELWSADWLQFKAAVAGHFAWAVPTEEAVDAIGSHAAQVIEIGCGSGYWAWLMQQRGVDVIAIDSAPPPHQWHDVVAGTEAEVARHPDRSLFLCWPPWAANMAYQALLTYRGETVIYVGEWMSGSAEARFFHLLTTAFEPVLAVDIPQWFMRTDQLTIHRRRSTRKGP